jgi:hypothetical protein
LLAFSASLDWKEQIMAITISKRALVFTVLAAAAVGTATFIYLKVFVDDDQNPIRVRNKQLQIETEDAKAHWAKKSGEAKKWILDGHNPKDVAEYVVTAYGANGCLDPLKGKEVVITYEVSGSPVTFAFRLAPKNPGSTKLEPELDAGVDMTADNSAPKVKKLHRTDQSVIGAITSLTVSNGTAPGNCTFPADRRVAVELCMHNCS